MYKIIAVDDEITIVTELEELLQSMGYEAIGLASSGEEAIKIAKKLKPDLILMDIVMPGRLNGIDATEIITAELDIPVIFLTAHADEKLIQRARNSGASGYIMKPFREDEIKANIEIALRGKDLERIFRDSIDQLSSSLKEKEVFMKEVHHRIKNNMLVLVSLIELQERYIKDKQVLRILKDIKYRIRTMGLIHEKLYQSQNLAKINFTEYIHDLTTSLFHGYNINVNIIGLNIDAGDDILFDVKTAIPCGLILNELVSNSLKYAFPEGREGEVNVKLTKDDDDKVTLIVSNNGVDFPEDLDFRNTESLGLQLVNMLTQQLDGTIELNKSGGATFKITFRVPK